MLDFFSGFKARRGHGSASWSHGDGDRAVPVQAQRVGADLRAARERLGWSLPEVATYLRIRLPFLEAIEDGRIADLPGNAYAIGFVRTYAQAIGLDPDEISRRFRAEAAAVNRRTELEFPAPVPERGVPALVVVLAGLVVAIGTYTVWYQTSGSAGSAGPLVEPVPERLASLVAQPKTAATGPMPASNAGAGAFAAASGPSSVALSPLSPHPDMMRGDGGRVMVRAVADSWLQVRGKDGRIVFDRVLKAGEIWPVPPGQPLTLTTGNAGATELLVDGRPAPKLGPDGVVRRDLSLDPANVRSGALAAVSPTRATLAAHAP